MNARHKNEAGFTLVEVLSVLVIIGLVSGTVLMTRPAPPSPAIAQADIMVGQLNFAAQHSMISGQTAALGVSSQSYALYTFEAGEWLEKESHIWPLDVRVNFALEGQDTELGDEMAPIAFFEPTGIATIFSLTLSGDNSRRAIISDGSGRIDVDEGA